ncbi:MAG: hypothetical protein A2138_27050 [Deltaproteobacteria bacterium RBG_16_71_12]|nr:MAG: hypothetical protein A2138_27050 [Deltaproteobacteria bacterium RBG_16_71_12]
MIHTAADETARPSATGVGSAGDVTARDIAGITTGAANSAIASQALVDYARKMVEMGRGKPDNVTAVVVTMA